MNKIIIFIIVLLFGITAYIILSKNTQNNIPSETPKYRSISKTNFFLGKFKPFEMVKIQAEISGILDSIYIKHGDKVSAGDKIAKLRIIPIPQEIQSMKRALQIASADLKQKEINHNRNTTLFKKGVIATSTFEETKLELNFAKIEYANAQNNYNIAKKGFSNNINASPNIVKSTINGEVLNVLVKKGENVTERNTFNDGNTIATIVNTNSYTYEFEITETDISDVKINDIFNVTIKALKNRTVKAKIQELKPLINNNNSFYYLASAVVLDTIPNIKPGYTGLAEFTLKQKNYTLSIKEKNIIYKNRKSFVELIHEKNRIKEVEIETGISDGIYTEIISGIKKSDKIKAQ